MNGWLLILGLNFQQRSQLQSEKPFLQAQAVALGYILEAACILSILLKLYINIMECHSAVVRRALWHMCGMHFLISLTPAQLGGHRYYYHPGSWRWRLWGPPWSATGMMTTELGAGVLGIWSQSQCSQTRYIMMKKVEPKQSVWGKKKVLPCLEQEGSTGTK